MLIPVLWGLLFGVLQAASPLAVWWLDHATVLTLKLVLIAAVYVGFAVADGRPSVIAVESAIAGLFVVLAATSITATAWLLVVGYIGHGLKDAWQQRRQYVANTRWWPPSAPPSTGSSPPSWSSRLAPEFTFISPRAHVRVSRQLRPAARTAGP